MHKIDSKLYDNLNKSYISDDNIILNIDSRNRNTISKNLIHYNTTLNNSLLFTNNSNLLRIKHVNHNLTCNDLITIKNVAGKKIKIQIDVGNFILNTNKLKLIIIDDNMNNITELSNKYNTTQYISIDNIENKIDYIYNININFLKNIYKIYYDDVDNYFYIKLFTNIYKTDTDTTQNICYITIQFLNIYGININRINSNYPLSNYSHQPFKQIYKIIDNNNYLIKLNHVAINVDNNKLYIGNNILIGKINKTIAKDNTNDYKINLNTSISNIKSIRIINTIIPHTEYNIYNNINNKKNNKLYFTILHENLYSITFNDGTYNPRNFITEIKKLVNEIKFNVETNINSIYLNTYINVDINITTNIIKFSFFRELNIINSFKILANYLKSDNVLLLINQNNHYLNIGDIITIENSESIDNINKLYINKKHKIFKIIDKDNYIIKLDCNKSSIIIDSNIVSDNNFTKITYPLKVSFDFTYSDTIGKLLGFSDIGLNTSITNYYNDIYNITPYKFEEKFDDDDKLVNKNNNNKLFNNDTYIFLYCNIYNNINSSSYNKILLCKLLLDNYGNYVYNRFVNMTNEYNTIIANVNSIRFTFEKYNGELYDFGNIDHSFVLQFIINKIENLHTNINTQTGLSNVASTIKRVTINKYN